MRDCGENICGMGGGSLNAVSVVDSTLSGFGVDIKVLQVVVEIDTSGAEVTSQKGCVGGEDGSDVNATLSTQWETDTSEPLVEMRNNGPRLFSGRELKFTY